MAICNECVSKQILSACLDFPFFIRVGSKCQHIVHTTTVERKVKKEFHFLVRFPYFPFFRISLSRHATRARLGGQQRETAAAGTVTIDKEKRSKKSLSRSFALFPSWYLCKAACGRPYMALWVQERDGEMLGLSASLNNNSYLNSKFYIEYKESRDLFPSVFLFIMFYFSSLSLAHKKGGRESPPLRGILSKHVQPLSQPKPLPQSATIQRIAMCIEQRQKENYGLQHLL